MNDIIKSVEKKDDDTLILRFARCDKELYVKCKDYQHWVVVGMPVNITRHKDD